MKGKDKNGACDLLNSYLRKMCKLYSVNPVYFFRGINIKEAIQANEGVTYLSWVKISHTNKILL